MKKQRILWFLVVCVVLGVFLLFNYQGAKDFMPLSDIFPQTGVQQGPAVEYVYMDTQPIAEENTPREVSLPKAADRLSPAAAQVIFQVEEKPVDQNVVKSSAFTIQVASFKKEQYAQAALEKLISQGHSGQVVTKDLENKGIWHRVYIGAFQNKGEAQDYLAKVKDVYPDSLIVTLK